MAKRNIHLNRKRSKTRWIIGGVIIASSVIGFSLLNLGDNLVYFYTPAEAAEKHSELESKIIKVGGMVKPGTVAWNAEQLELRFTMTDLKDHEIQVEHKGTPPDLFKEGQGVVVEGRLIDVGHRMVSHKLMVKHSEEYKKTGDHSTMNKALLEESIYKGGTYKP